MDFCGNIRLSFWVSMTVPKHFRTQHGSENLCLNSERIPWNQIPAWQIAEQITFDTPGLSLKFSSRGKMTCKHLPRSAFMNLHEDYIFMGDTHVNTEIFFFLPAHARHHRVDCKNKLGLFSIISIFIYQQEKWGNSYLHDLVLEIFKWTTLYI